MAFRKKVKDLIGTKFGKLTVIKYVGYNKKTYKHKWLCRCECGKEVIVQQGNLENGHTKSCGCLRKEINSGYIHGKSHTRLFNIWASMRERCNCLTCTIYKYYGGRGVRICEEWDKYINFEKWALANGYKDNLTIDRKDVNGNYEPSNCRWATSKQQCNNRTSNRIIEINGAKHTLSEWSEISEINVTTIYMRLKRGIRGPDLLRKIKRRDKK